MFRGKAVLQPFPKGNENQAVRLLGTCTQTAVVTLGIVQGLYSTMGGRGKGGGSATFMRLLTQKPGEEFSLKPFRFCIWMNEEYGPSRPDQVGHRLSLV